VAWRCPNPDCPDIELFGVVGEYTNGVTHCPKCGTELRAPDPPIDPPAESLPNGQPEWIEPVLPDKGDFSYVASFRDLADAHIARGLLLDAGFYAELLDEHLIGINWMYSQANHGVKVVVKTDRPDDARKLLETDASDLLMDLPEMTQAPTPFDRCPRCESEDVTRPRWSQALKALALLFVWPFLFVPIAAHFEPTRCNSCGRYWHPQWVA
jgi:predicted Zn-ribbon and HTH transcriptional regulator